MANFNKVILLGNLTRDIELRTSQGGMAIAKFGMAINRKWSQNGEQKESTCFVDLTAFGRQAEVLNQYVKKGSQLFIEGREEDLAPRVPGAAAAVGRRAEDGRRAALHRDRLQLVVHLVQAADEAAVR